MKPFQQTIGTVERNINSMLQYQSHTRSSEARDFALLVDNNAYVANWSMIQIFVILLTCSIQVSVPITHRNKKKINRFTLIHFMPFSLSNDTTLNLLNPFFSFLLQTGIFCAKTIRYKYRRLWTSTNLNYDQKPIQTNYTLL